MANAALQGKPLLNLLPLPRCTLLQRPCINLAQHRQRSRVVVSALTTSNRRNASDIATPVQHESDFQATPTVKKVIESKTQEPLNLDFDDFRKAHKSKTTIEICRALAVFKLCSVSFLVERNKELMRFGRAVCGEKLFNLLMKGSFYGHFVAGEDQDAIKPRIQTMERFGVGAILDYAVEADIPSSDDTLEPVGPCEEAEKHLGTKDLSDVHNRYRFHRKFADRSKDLFSARTYIYEGEEKCDRNMEVFLQCIDTTGYASSSGFAAIKLTALGRPLLLLRLSQILNQTQHYFDHLAVDSDHLLEKSIARETFYYGLQDLGISMAKAEADHLFQIIDEDDNGNIDIIEWHNFLTPQLQLQKLFRAKPKKHGVQGEVLLSSMSDTEIAEMENMMDRLHKIAERATDRGVRLMVDAEQTYFQPAISRLTLEAQRKFNKIKPVVFNTYQCYLKESKDNITIDLERAKREGFAFGAKLVRGAYMEQERARAQTLGYADPIHPSYEETNNCYNGSLDKILSAVVHDGANVMVASHNEQSVEFTVQRMRDLGIKPQDGNVFFGQLLGMCDGITFALGQEGYAAYKYVPYGPVKEVLPYLSRRVVENRGLLGGVRKERGMLFSELARRFRSGELNHDPNKGAIHA